MNSKMNKYLQNKKAIEKLQQENEMLGNDIIEYMQSKGISSYTTPSGVISLIEETTTFRFDSARFKQENIAQYNTYLKESTTKAHLTTKLTK